MIPILSVAYAIENRYNFYDTGHIFFPPLDLGLCNTPLGQGNAFDEPSFTILAPSGRALSVNGPFALPLFPLMVSPLSP
jgi:hypothetical protein